MKNETLETMAREMVGDGGHPNILFLSGNGGEIMAVLNIGSNDYSLDREVGIKVARMIGAEVIEDRLEGVVWEANDKWRDDPDPDA